MYIFKSFKCLTLFSYHSVCIDLFPTYEIMLPVEKYCFEIYTILCQTQNVYFIFYNIILDFDFINIVDIRYMYIRFPWF